MNYEEIKKESVKEWYGDGYDPDEFTLYECSNFRELGMELFYDGSFEEIPEWLIGYIDYEKLGRDYFLESDAVKVEYGFLFYHG